MPASKTPATGVRAMFHVKRSAALLRRYLLLMGLAAGLLGTTSGCVTTGTNPVSGNERVYGYTWEEEQQLGQRADQQIQAQYGIYDDDEVQRYVDRVGQAVLEESDLRDPGTEAQFRNTEFTFRVLDSPVVNAFALPGGYVYVTRGLMSHLNNEAQLAVVLGHEITHVAARHASAQAGKQQLGQLGLLLGGLGAAAAGLPAGQLLRGAQQATQLLFLEYSRDNEEEADVRGVEYAAQAGYEVSEGSEFFRTLERIQQKQGQALPTWLSTHPDPGNREQRILELAQQYGQGTTRVEQEPYYDVIDGMIMGENPRHGYTEGNTFYHPDLAFRFPVPSGFGVNNTRQAVIMVEQNQRAQMQLTVSGEASSAQQAAQQALQQLGQQGGVQVLDRGRAESNGLPAYYLVVQAQTQQGQALRALLYYLEYDGNVYAFQGVAPAQLFSRYRDVFLRTVRGFAPLRDQSRLNVQPTRLSIERPDQSAPFRRFVEGGTDIGDLSAQDLAIINQVELSQQIDAGRPLKLPRRN